VNSIVYRSHSSGQVFILNNQARQLILSIKREKNKQKLKIKKT